MWPEVAKRVLEAKRYGPEQVPGSTLGEPVQPDTMSSVPRYAALWVCFVALLSVFVWFSIVDHSGVNGQDGHDYWRLSRAWSAWASGGERPHLQEHPHGYPILGALIGGAWGSELEGLRVISALSLLVMVALWRAVLRRAFFAGPKLELFLVFSLVLSPFLLRYSMVVMSDVPAIALAAAAFSATVRWCKAGVPASGAWWLILAILTTGMALTVRLAVAPVVPVFIVAWVYGPEVGRRWRMGAAMLLVLIAMLVLLLTPGWPWLMELVRGPLREWTPWNLLRRELVSDDGILRYVLPNGFYVLSVFGHPGFLPLGLLLLPFLQRSDLAPLHARLALGVVVVYLLFIGGLPFQNDRVLLFAQPFVALLLFPAFVRALEWASARGLQGYKLVAPVMVVQAVLFIRAMLPFVQQGSVERDLIALVVALNPSRVYTHGMGAAFDIGCPNAMVTELWYGDIEVFEPGALFVVRPSDLAEQWVGHPPLDNWLRARSQGVQVLLERSDGWTIARVMRSPSSAGPASRVL